MRLQQTWLKVASSTSSSHVEFRLYTGLPEPHNAKQIDWLPPQTPISYCVSLWNAASDFSVSSKCSFLHLLTYNHVLLSLPTTCPALQPLGVGTYLLSVAARCNVLFFWQCLGFISINSKYAWHEGIFLSRLLCTKLHGHSLVSSGTPAYVTPFVRSPDEPAKVLLPFS